MSTPVVYANFKLKQNNGNAIDLTTAAIKVMIVTSAYTAAAATHAFKSDLTGEVSGTNYSARGTAIGGVTLTLSSTTALWVHNDITWSQSAGAGFSNGRTFVWYVDTGVDATSKLIMYMTEAADFGNVAGDLVLDGSAVTGVLNVS
jgi:hypothetical protein